jgi:hypothetical protein
MYVEICCNLREQKYGQERKRENLKSMKTLTLLIQLVWGVNLLKPSGYGMH